MKHSTMTHSLRMRITVVTVLLIVIAVLGVTLTSVFFIRNNERQQSQQLLLLMCETGERNLDYYFSSVQKSLSKVSDFVQEDIDGLEDELLTAHMSRVEKYFDEMAYRTNGVLTYYYRIDPAISSQVKGFWFTNMDGEGFVPHEPTDITAYDTADTSQLVWFTVPKFMGESVWLPPYITDNLGARVISYNIPIHYRGQFVGVIGIEIDYSTMAKQVESIRLYDSGLAYLTDEEGTLFFHPRIDVSVEAQPPVPDEIRGASTFFRYTFEGVEKVAAWLPLENNMRLVVAVPVSETEGDWQSLIGQIALASLIILAILSGFTLYYTGRITRPLEELTHAAEQVDHGDYSFTLDYDGDDEVGRLTRTFRVMSSHMNDYISDLNRRINTDALTSVKNKGAYALAMEKLQTQLDQSPSATAAFAIGAFDCNDLKQINDVYGHDKGDEYLKTSCRLICQTFQHSPVFRTGGDEFAVILQNQDYDEREKLIQQFINDRDMISAKTPHPWQEVHVAMGVAEHDPNLDHTVIDTAHRADAMMYADKRRQKEAARKKTT